MSQNHTHSLPTQMELLIAMKTHGVRKVENENWRAKRSIFGKLRTWEKRFSMDDWGFMYPYWVRVTLPTLRMPEPQEA